VRFVDLVSSDLYPTVLAAADVVLVNERPTVREMSMPSKITSYLAAGRPVVGAVANRGTTHTELRATGGAAYTVPAGRPDLLAAALSELVGETRELRAMSEAGRAFAAANLSPAGALDALLNVIRGALAGTGRPLQLSSLHEGADIPGQSDG
jgi:glycosyltransferase involved in cell wall biosynthesis